MKRFFSIIIICILSFSYLKTNAQVRALMTYTTYLDTEQNPYIETFLNIDAKSVKYIKKDKTYQGVIEITMVFKKDDKIITFSKVDLSTPAENDSIPSSPNIIDIQRIAIPNGEYDFEISLKDKNTSKEATIYKDKITINHPQNTISISGIQLMDKIEPTKNPNIFTKHNYDMYPYISDFFPEKINTLTAFAEIYNTSTIYGDSSEYIYRIFVEDFESSRIVTNLFKMKKENSAKVKILTNSFDISKLPSGNYNLVIEVRNKDNKVDAFNKFFFQRSNPSVSNQSSDLTTLDIANTFVEKFNNLDTLALYLDFLYPISSIMERNYALNLIPKRDKKHTEEIKDKTGLISNMQRYLLNFWVGRDENAPEAAWLKYLSEVKKVNADFGKKNQMGYLSDRGRVYLKYGSPNSINSQTREPSSYPYEIWHYYQVAGQGNVRFVFYNRDLVTNDYELLHSDANGELKDYQWQMKLQKRQNPSNNPNQNSINPYWGGNSDEYWKRPR